MGAMPQLYEKLFFQIDKLEHLPDRAEITRQLGEMLDRAPLFSGFTVEDVSMLAGYVGLYRAGAGETIIREGEDGDFMLLITSGEVDILKRGVHFEQTHLTTVGAGTTVGEMSMIDGEPRFATCRTAQPTTFAVLTRDDLAKIVREQPHLAAKLLLKVASMLSARLRQTSSKVIGYMEGVH